MKLVGLRSTLSGGEKSSADEAFPVPQRPRPPSPDGGGGEPAGDFCASSTVITSSKERAYLLPGSGRRSHLSPQSIAFASTGWGCQAFAPMERNRSASRS